MLAPLPRPEDYSISESTGFLPEVPLTDHLCDSYFEPWETLAGHLQSSIKAGRLRAECDALPVLDIDRLRDEGEERRAYSILIFLANGYIWMEEPACERLPPSLSVPLLDISERLELPPIATYAGLCLWNFRPTTATMFEADAPLDELDTVRTFTGSFGESWFYLVSVAIELRGASIIPLLMGAMAAARGDRPEEVATLLEEFTSSIHDLQAILQRLPECCEPDFFYNDLRPYLAGTANGKKSGIPNGVLYEDKDGVTEYRQDKGGSNAQSSLIQFFDLVLGVEHSGGKKDHRSFIHDMRNYMPGPHRRFLEAIEDAGDLHPFVVEHDDCKRLQEAYTRSLAAMASLRTEHMQIVARYIICPSRRQSLAEKVERPSQDRTADDDSSALTGTGGTDLICFLKHTRDETKEKMTCDVNTCP